MEAQGITSLLVFVAVGLTAAACGSPADEKPGAVKQPTDVPKAAIPPSKETPCFLPEYDLEMVKNSPKTADQAILSTTLVAKMVRQNPGLPPLFKKYNTYWRLHALDTVRCKHFIMISYLYEHEDCCSDLYYVTFTSDSKKVIDWATIAQTGADGMWSATATMSAREVRLRVTALADDDEGGDGESSFRDSVVTDYSVTPQGKFVRARIDSVRTKLASRP